MTIMPNIANISFTVQRFTQSDGSRVAIEPGQSAPVDLPRDSKFITAKERAGLIRVGGTKRQAAKAARTSPAGEDASSETSTE
jgi:hypothetical protein